MSTSRRIPSLDGLRAISIAFVVMAHAVGTRGLAVPREHFHWFALGNLGVRVFFVISGFLITSLLLNEWRRTDTISLRQFYLRRTFRIFPAFYVFVLVMIVLNALGVIALRSNDAVHAVTYTMNYHHDRAWQVGHIWSLAVEEQFYLLWPAILLIAGARRGVWVAVAWVLAAPIARTLTYRYFPSGREGIGESFQTVADAIAAGCMLAYVRDRLSASKRYVASQKSLLWLALPVIVLVVNFERGYISISYPIGETVMNVCIALMVDWAIRNHEGVIGRVLNWQPLVAIGLLSYSLYLWQQPFLNRHTSWWGAAFPLNVLLALCAATASYYLIEQPMLRLRARISRGAHAV